MPDSYEKVREIASELPAEQRILLANSLWESVNLESSEAAWDAEIARRVAEIRSGTARTCTLEELEADLRTIVGP